MPSIWITLPAILLAATPAAPQSTTAPLAFDVASVRPSKPDAPQHTNVPLDSGNVYSTVSPDDARTAAGGYLIATHQPLWRYLTFAYRLSGTQELALRFNMFSGTPKSGAPFWVTGGFDAAPEFFDISARAPADTSLDQLRLMMQTLLAERFHLATHFVSADAPVFALVRVSAGATTIATPGLHPHPASDPCLAATPADPGHPAATSDPALPPVCGVIAPVPSSSPGLHYGGRAVSLALLATSIPTMTGIAATPRPVVDQTGLPGLFDVTLSWNHTNSATGEDATTADNADNFRRALKQQLGLKLKPAHAPISFLIIEHVERPPDN